VPIVFAQVTDPVGAGFIDSLAHPGGNATGLLLFEYSISGKWLELLKEIAPRVTRAAVIPDAAPTAGTGQFGVVQSVAPSVGMEVGTINVRDAAEIEPAIAAFARTADANMRRSGTDELWIRHCGRISSVWCLCWPYSQRHEACRAANRASE